MTGLSSLPSLSHVLIERARRDPDGRAFSILTAGEDDLHVTNAQLYADALRQARALDGAGVEPGALVVVAGEHGYPVLAGFCGALLQGAVPTVAPYVSERSAGDAYEGRVQRLVEQAGARAVLTVPGLRDFLAERLTGRPVAVLALPTGVGEAGAVADEASARGDDDDAYVQFSSGTTSEPKGAVLSHRAVLAYVRSIEESGGMGPDDVFVGWAPLFHDLGLLTCFLLPLCTGATGVLLAPGAWMRRPATLLQAVHDYGGTATWMPNFAFARTRGAVRDDVLATLDLSRWRFVGCGGEPIVASELNAFADWLAPTGFRPEALVAGYGMAESVLGAAHGRAEAPLHAEHVSGTALRERLYAEPVAPDAVDAVAVTSCGMPAPGMDIRIVDDAGRPVGERAVGEVALRGDFLLSRYWRRPDLTDRARRDGWFHTGDVGYLAGGELYVCDRKGDLVIVGGKNVYPDHVEALTRGVLGKTAKFVAAFGLPDERLGTEQLVLVVEAQGRPSDDEKQTLAEAVRHAVLDEMDVSPADVRFVGRGVVVRTTSGKVSRASTREQYLAAGFAPTPTQTALPLPPPGALADELRALGRTHLGVDAAPADNLFEAGADSIRVMEFILTVAERYGRDLPTDVLMAQPTLARLAQALRQPASVTLPDVPAAITEARTRASSQPATPKQPDARRVRLVRRLLRRPDGLQRLWAFVGSRVGRGLFPADVALVRKVLATVPSSEPAEAVVQRSLFTNLARLFGEGDDAGDDGLLQRVEIHGEADLAEALASQQGALILTSHSAGRQGLLSVLRERGAMDRTATIGRARPLRLAGWSEAEIQAAQRTDAWDAFENRMLAQQLGGALDRLRDGGAVVIAGDGQLGQGGREVTFHGRPRWVGLGFAELAERSGARVVATFDVLDADGTLHLHVAPIPAPSAETREERLTAWLDAYVGQLERFWVDHLGSVRWGMLRAVLRAPGERAA